MSLAAVPRWAPAKRLALGESVASSLREAILEGRLKPGERLAQAQLANELGVSQAPVRDALSILEREGLVERTTGSGATVMSFSPADIEEICGLRSALEVLAVRLAIRHATPDDLKLLEKNILAMMTAKRPGEAGLLDLQFHELLVHSTRHRRLESCWKTLQSQIKLALVQQDIVNPEYPRVVAEGHRQLLEQIRAKNEPEAVRLLEVQLAGFHRCACKLSAGDDAEESR